MDSFRLSAVCAISVAVFSICACATAAKRLSEDLKNNGFAISLCDDADTVTMPTVRVTDEESTERLLQWLCRRPRKSSDLASEIFQQSIEQSVAPWSQTIKIEATHIRVKIRTFAALTVVLETRDAAVAEWNKESWKMRPEDVELRDWAISQIKENCKRDLQERGLLDENSAAQH